MNRGCPGPRSAGAPHRPVGGGETWTSKAPGEAVRGQVGDAGQTQMPVGCEGERGMEETKTEAPVTVPHHRLFETTVGVVGQGTGARIPCGRAAWCGSRPGMRTRSMPMPTVR